MVHFKDKHIIVQNKPTFLFGGEVHYFRIPKDEWEDRILKVKQAGGNLVSTYIPWIIHESNQGDIDVTGRNRPENDIGTFLSLIKKHDMFCMIRPGPYIMSEIKNEGLPFWLYETYEDIVALNRKGEQHPSRSVYLLHKGYLKFVDKWYEALGRVIKPFHIDNGGCVVLGQLDNEIGMMHWCCGEGDYSKGNIEDFKKYLEVKYGGSLETEYPGVDFSNGFYRFVCNPGSGLNSKLREDFSLYHREYFKSYFEVLKEKFYRYFGTMPVVCNIHGFDSVDVMKRGKQYPIGVSQLSRVADCENTLMAGDYYIGNIVYDNFQDIILANAFTNAIQSPEQPLFSAEFQGGFQVDTPRMQPTTYDLTTRICIANGMNSVNYYMFAGGTNLKGTDLLGRRHSWQAPVDTDGSLNPQYPIIAHLGQMIQANEQPLLSTRQESVLTLGLIPDYYMTEYRDEQTQEICNELKLYREELLFEGMGKGLAVMNLTFEGYDLTQDMEIPIKEYPKMAIFSTRYMDEKVQRRIIEYIKNGGQAVIFPTLPTMNLKGEPCTVMLDALSCSAEVHDFGFADYIDDVENLIIFNATDFGEAEKSFARHEKGFNCGFTKELGKGLAVCFGVGMAHDYYYRDKVILNLFEKIGVSPLLKSDCIKDKLLLSARVNDNGGRYLFIQNIDEYEKCSNIYLKGQRIFEKPLTFNPRSGLMLPHNMQICEGVKVLVSTAEIIKLESLEEKIQITIRLTQIEDYICLDTHLKVLPSKDYEVLGNKVISNLDGRIHKSLTISLSR